MKTLSYFFVFALLACLSCSDDEVPVRGKLIIDDQSYDLHTVYGQAQVGSDFGYYSYTLINSKGKMKNEELSGKGINGIHLEFYRESNSNEPITGTFYNDDSEEHYEIEYVSAVIGYNAATDDGDFYEEFESAAVTITKNGSKYTFAFAGVTEDGIEVSMTFNGPLKKLADLEVGPL